MYTHSGRVVEVARKSSAFQWTQMALSWICIGHYRQPSEYHNIRIIIKRSIEIIHYSRGWSSINVWAVHFSAKPARINSNPIDFNFNRWSVAIAQQRCCGSLWNASNTILWVRRKSLALWNAIGPHLSSYVRALVRCRCCCVPLVDSHYSRIAHTHENCEIIKHTADGFARRTLLYVPIYGILKYFCGV